MEEERLLSLAEACEVLGKSERTLYRWIKSGKLKAYKPGRDYEIPESAIQEMRERSEVYPKVQAPLFTPEQVAEPRRLEAIIDDLREWLQTAAHVQEFARADREELQKNEELPRGWQRGVFGARAVHDNVGRLSREAEEVFGLDNMPRELLEAVEEAKSAANATLSEALQFFNVAEEVANRAGVREDADVHDLREFLEKLAA